MTSLQRGITWALSLSFVLYGLLGLAYWARAQSLLDEALAEAQEENEQALAAEATGDDDITFLEIIAETLNPSVLGSCLNWRPVGFCVFYTPPYEVDTSLKYAHNLPDFVVSSYYLTGNNPFREAELLFGEAARVSGETQLGILNLLPDNGLGGHGHTEVPRSGRSTNLNFREVSVIGAPMANWFWSNGAGFFSPSETTLMTPYYLSVADAWHWRYGPFELLYPETWIPGLQEVGNWPLDRWGSVFPRVGFLVQAMPWRASYVIGMRAANVVTSEQVVPRVYIASESTRNDRGNEVTWPDPVDPDNGLWQRVYPDSTGECLSYGKEEPELGPPYEVMLEHAKARSVYQLWREYRFCQRVGAVLILDFDIEQQ